MLPIETVELIVAAVVSIVVAYIVFTANFVQAFSYTWVLLVGLVLIGAGKLMSIKHSERSKMMTWWNLAFFALLAIGAVLITFSNLTYARAGAWVIAIACIIDIPVTVYNYYSIAKLAATQAEGKEVAAPSKEQAKENVFSMAAIIVGDIITATGTLIGALRT